MPAPEQPELKGQPDSGAKSEAEAALFGLCPCCGHKGLFSGLTRFADNCSGCGLDYTQFNVGDGPAAFLTLIIGGVVATLAILLELKAQPPFWVHAVLWIPLTSGAVIFGLRGAKAWLLGAEYRRHAGEGRLKDT
ncbi:MAG: hypothetical protein RLZZ136_922 [Pseudomonadota bacterium]|jgi:uncharacterized protein (DUF983 family)